VTRALRLWADRHAVTKFQHRRRKHHGARSTISADISACGQFVATSHGDHTVRVWQFDSGEAVQVGSKAV